MPTIFEINCASKLIHDFNSEKNANELYGFSYTLISNQFLADSFPIHNGELPDVEIIDEML
ncbi:hypothetical protein D3C86_2213310 [compost metagenome]